jgi:hypothetical protein
VLLLAMAKKVQRWAVSIIRKRGEYLGTVEAPDEQAAIAKAVIVFEIGLERRNRIVVTKLDEGG